MEKKEQVAGLELRIRLLAYVRSNIYTNSSSISIRLRFSTEDYQAIFSGVTRKEELDDFNWEVI